MVKIKVCGMRETANITAVLALQPDYMGFIFYEKSPRYAGEDLSTDLLLSFPKTTRKIGVFVNAHNDLILRNVKKYGLDLVQLHGEETPDMCRGLRSRGLTIVKAFAVNEEFNFSRLNNYKSHCDYFLFDTKGENPGGNGQLFDWSLLQKYDNEKPFFLGGGIGPTDADKVAELQTFNLHAVELNSRFETSPGLKDPELIRSFVARLKDVLQEDLA